MNTDIKRQIEEAKAEFAQERKKNPDLLVKAKKKGRINHKKVEYKGMKFDSLKELIIYKENEMDPEIKILEIHPYFELFPGFKRGKKKIQDISYTADQKVFNGKEGREEIWEVKSKGSKKMADYALRKKLFLMQYPDVVFREITFDKQKRTEQVFLP